MSEPLPSEPEPTSRARSSGSAASADDVTSSAAARLPWLLAGWGVSSLLLIAAIVVLFVTDAALLGVVLFILGAVGTAAVSIGLLRTRASVRQSS